MSAEQGRGVRMDRLLFFLRFAKSRTLAQKLVASGHLRHNGERTAHLDRMVKVGDVLTLPLSAGVAVVEILELPARRGPPPEAQSCYRVLDAGQTMSIAGDQPPHQKSGTEREGKSPQ